MLYNVRQEKEGPAGSRSFCTLKTEYESKPHQTTQPLGDCRKVTAADLKDLQPTGTLSINTNESTH